MCCSCGKGGGRFEVAVAVLLPGVPSHRTACLTLPRVSETTTTCPLAWIQAAADEGRWFDPTVVLDFQIVNVCPTAFCVVTLLRR
jgi:hypothetical protein